MTVNRLNWQPPSCREPSRPAANQRSGTRQSRGNPFPSPAESLSRLSDSHQPTEARLLLSPGANIDVFRQAFGEVWDQIPGHDRNRMLTYWRDDDTGDPDRYRSPLPIPPKPRPHLLLVPDDSIADGDAECREDGHVLAFRVSLTTSNRERLPAGIATALAQVHRIVTRDAGLLLLALHETFDAWADAHAEATDDEWAQAWQPLEEEYMRSYWKETNDILQHWGFPPVEIARR